MKSLFAALLTVLSFSAFSALAAPPNVEFTPEQRKQMAEMHSKAAACLNSNKTMQECRDEMMKNSSAMGMGMGMGRNWGCPMMGTGPQPDTKTKTTK
ncbi:MAG: hypothetical protein ACXWRE_10360 [Pseudobdellovibrionaceae bacterium]